MTNMMQPAAALPAMQVGMVGQPMIGQPMMGQPMMGPVGMVGQPVYVSSLAQLPPGAVPVSQQMLAQALGQGQLGAQVVQPQGTSPLRSMLKGAAIGGAAGAAFGIIPFLPLGLISGGLVGAGVGAAIGLVTGLRRKKAEGEFHTMQQQQAMAAAQAQAQMVASTPAGARSSAPAEAAPARQGVVMGPEMRKKWAAKVRAEQAAAQAKQG